MLQTVQMKTTVLLVIIRMEMATWNEYKDYT